MTFRRTRHSHARAAAALTLLCLLLPPARASAKAPAGAPALLTYEEIVRLYELPTPPAELRRKLDELLTTPFVSNAAAERGARPLKPRSERLGRFLRVAFWNVERGLEYEAIEKAFQGPEALAPLLGGGKRGEGGGKLAAALEEAALLSAADVVVLNEVDWGLKRTGYRNVAAELAEALGMNYAFGVEFVEVDPVTIGVERFDELSMEDRAALVEQTKVDPSRYLGLHGTAILSRYPLENVRLVPFGNQGHDWYAGELRRVSKVEKGRRKAAEVAFRQTVEREVRRGGRMMLLAEVADPDIPGGRLTVVATHLEAKTKPRDRLKQLRELLVEIKDVRHPVVVAGDMNTSGRDSTPTSVGRELKKRLGSKKFWAERVVKYATGFGLPFGFLRGGINEYRKQADPTVRHIPYVAPNPEAAFFDALKSFRFEDGGAFDFRGDRERSAGDNGGPLSNSNQRGGKGFVTTFAVERRIGFVGTYKLDWIFVKPPALTDPYGDDEPYRFAPHFGRTLKELNQSVEDRISDHAPLVVDLPFGEPPIR